MKSSIFLFLFLSCQFLANGQDQAYIKKLILKTYKDQAFKEDKIFNLIKLDLLTEEASAEQKKKMNRKDGMYLVRFEIKAYTVENRTGLRHNISGRYFILYTHQYELLMLDTF